VIRVELATRVGGDDDDDETRETHAKRCGGSNGISVWYVSVYTASHPIYPANYKDKFGLARNGDAAHSKQHGFTATPDLEADADADAARSILEIKLTDLHLGGAVTRRIHTSRPHRSHENPLVR
jgi:hypothetical protein